MTPTGKLDYVVTGGGGAPLYNPRCQARDGEPIGRPSATCPGRCRPVPRPWPVLTNTLPLHHGRRSRRTASRSARSAPTAPRSSPACTFRPIDGDGRLRVRTRSMQRRRPPPQPVKPAVEDGRHVLAWDDVAFEVDAATGGRVTALRLGGRNLLTGPASTPATTGRRSGPARRPPGAGRRCAEIDHGPYRARGRAGGDRACAARSARRWACRSRSASPPTPAAAR